MTFVTCAPAPVSPLDLEAARLDQVAIPTPDGTGLIQCSGWGVRQRSSGAWLFTPGSHVWGVGQHKNTRVSAPVHLQDKATANWIAQQGLHAGAYLMAFG